MVYPCGEVSAVAFFVVVVSSLSTCTVLHVGQYVTFFGKTETNAFPLNGQEKRL